MADLIARLTEQPILFLLLLFVVGGVVYGVLKRLLRLAMVLMLGFVALAGYFALAGKPPPPAMQRVTERAQEKLERGADLGREKARRVREGLERSAQEAVERSFGQGER